jgi:hypothetical protein
MDESVKRPVTKEDRKEARRLGAIRHAAKAYAPQKSPPRPHPPSAKAARKSVRSSTTAVAVPAPAKRKRANAPMSPNSRMAHMRNVRLARINKEQELKSNIELLSMPKGRVRTYEDNCSILRVVEVLRLQALHKDEVITRTELGVKVGELMGCAVSNGQTSCAVELIRAWDSDKHVIVTERDRSGVDYAGRRRLQALHLVEIESFIGSRHKKGSHVTTPMLVEHLGTSRTGTGTDAAPEYLGISVSKQVGRHFSYPTRAMLTRTYVSLATRAGADGTSRADEVPRLFVDENYGKRNQVRRL